VTADIKCLSTDLITGEIQADNIPLTVQSCTSTLNGGGTCTASLNLQSPYALNSPWLMGLLARKNVLWVLADDYPVWCGVVWDWPDMTRMNGGALSIQASTIDSVWSHRLITDTLEYPAIDLYTVFLDLITYGMTKNSPYISTAAGVPNLRPAAMLAWMASNGAVANLVLPQGQTAGVPWTASYMWSDQTAVSDAWSDMVSSGNFEYVFTPGLIGSNQPCINVNLGYQTLGRPVSESGYAITYGQGGNCTDYGYQITGSQGANAIWATAPANGSLEQWQSVYPNGWDLADLAAGFPVMETTVSWEGSTVTQQSQVDGFANGELEIYTQGMCTPTLNLTPVINPGAAAMGATPVPTLQAVVLGDAFPFSATSPLHPPVVSGGQALPGLVQELRVTSVTWYPPGPQQSEYVQVSTTAVTQT
jgi:hypothetical protein